MDNELYEQINNLSVNEEIITKSNDSCNPEGKKIVIEDKIILNVGGVKYETFRSTLTAYPDTLLGIMFSERNKEMIHPTNGNEYFFDRDGYLFRYVLQYYRTGKVHWPELSNPIEYNSDKGSRKYTSSPEAETEAAGVTSSSSNNTIGSGGGNYTTLPFTRAELEQELLFFLIPTKSDEELIESLLHEESSNNTPPPLTFANKAVVDNVNGFLHALKKVMYCIASLFEKKIMITFYHDRKSPIFKIIPPNPNIVMNELAPFNEKLRNILIPYAGVGYTLLMNFEYEIETWMKEEIKELKWYMEKPGGLPNRFVLYLSFNDKFLKQQILRNSILARVMNGGGSGGNANGSGSGNENSSSNATPGNGLAQSSNPSSNPSSATSSIGNISEGGATNFSESS